MWDVDEAGTPRDVRAVHRNRACAGDAFWLRPQREISVGPKMLGALVGLLELGADVHQVAPLIRGLFLDEQRCLIARRRGPCRTRKGIRATIARLEAQLGRSPNPLELARALDSTADAARGYLRREGLPISTERGA